jgi:hypothetical protein
MRDESADVVSKPIKDTAVHDDWSSALQHESCRGGHQTAASTCIEAASQLVDVHAAPADQSDISWVPATAETGSCALHSLFIEASSPSAALKMRSSPLAPLPCPSCFAHGKALRSQMPLPENTSQTLLVEAADCSLKGAARPGESTCERGHNMDPAANPLSPAGKMVRGCFSNAKCPNANADYVLKTITAEPGGEGASGELSADDRAENDPHRAVGAYAVPETISTPEATGATPEPSAQLEIILVDAAPLAAEVTTPNGPKVLEDAVCNAALGTISKSSEQAASFVTPVAASMPFSVPGTIPETLLASAALNLTSLQQQAPVAQRSDAQLQAKPEALSPFASTVSPIATATDTISPVSALLEPTLGATMSPADITATSASDRLQPPLDRVAPAQTGQVAPAIFGCTHATQSGCSAEGTTLQAQAAMGCDLSDTSPCVSLPETALSDTKMPGMRLSLPMPMRATDSARTPAFMLVPDTYSVASWSAAPENASFPSNTLCTPRLAAPQMPTGVPETTVPDTDMPSAALFYAADLEKQCRPKSAALQAPHVAVLGTGAIRADTEILATRLLTASPQTDAAVDPVDSCAGTMQHSPSAVASAAGLAAQATAVSTHRSLPVTSCAAWSGALGLQRPPPKVALAAAPFERLLDSRAIEHKSTVDPGATQQRHQSGPYSHSMATSALSVQATVRSSHLHTCTRDISQQAHGEGSSNDAAAATALSPADESDELDALLAAIPTSTVPLHHGAAPQPCNLTSTQKLQETPGLRTSVLVHGASRCSVHSHPRPRVTDAMDAYKSTFMKMTSHPFRCTPPSPDGSASVATHPSFGGMPSIGYKNVQSVPWEHSRLGQGHVSHVERSLSAPVRQQADYYKRPVQGKASERATIACNSKSSASCQWIPPQHKESCKFPASPISSAARGSCRSAGASSDPHLEHSKAGICSSTHAPVESPRPPQHTGFRADGVGHRDIAVVCTESGPHNPLYFTPHTRFGSELQNVRLQASASQRRPEMHADRPHGSGDLPLPQQLQKQAWRPPVRRHSAEAPCMDMHTHQIRHGQLVAGRYQGACNPTAHWPTQLHQIVHHGWKSNTDSTLASHSSAANIACGAQLPPTLGPCPHAQAICPDSACAASSSRACSEPSPHATPQQASNNFQQQSCDISRNALHDDVPGWLDPPLVPHSRLLQGEGDLLKYLWHWGSVPPERGLKAQRDDIYHTVLEVRVDPCARRSRTCAQPTAGNREATCCPQLRVYHKGCAMKEV